MAIVAGQTFTQSTADTAIDTILTQEANRIGPDIHRRTLHTSPWMDLIKQTKFPEGMGYQLGTLIYDRALPSTTNLNNASVIGMNWIDVGGGESASILTTNTPDQILTGARDTMIGAGTNNANGKSFIRFNRQFKQYGMKRAVVESPRINVEDLRFAAHRQEQLRAILDSLTDSTKYAWEERYRDEYDRVCANYVICEATSSVFASTKENTNSADIDFGAAGTTPSANISNKIMDSLYFRLVRGGAGTNAYGRENARPVFAIVCSSEASYFLQTEAGFRDDIRYNQSKVSELIAPLGVEKSFRGFYHLVDDLAPRYTDDGDGNLTRVQPYSMTNGVVSLNASYETAPIEALYVLHQDVMESQIPDPISGSNGLTFDPVNYRGKFNWKNIPSVDLNPDGTIGFFRGVLASASKPIKTEFGYVVLFKRDSTTPAA
jgi:hypothetical protein